MHRKIPLPRAWNRRTKAAILQILALSHYAFTAVVARASNDRDHRTRFRAVVVQRFLTPPALAQFIPSS